MSHGQPSYSHVVTVSGTGKIVCWKDKAGKVVGCGDRVPPEYDNLIAKLMAHAGDRDQAIDRLRRESTRTARYVAALRIDPTGTDDDMDTNDPPEFGDLDAFVNYERNARRAFTRAQPNASSHLAQRFRRIVYDQDTLTRNPCSETVPIYRGDTQ